MALEVAEAARLGLVDDNLLAVHVVGVDAEGVERLVGSRVTVVWCPTSNEFLFGKTAPCALLERADVLIGTDSLLTGTGTLLDELRCARTYGVVSDERLLGAVGRLAAAKLRMAGPRLTSGAPADLVLLARPVLEASAEDVSLVIVAGVPRVGDERYARLFEHMAVPADRIGVGGRSKLVSSPLGVVADRVLAEWPDARRAFGAIRG
jgi:cytosine/adenosine deaminase-related metal-dependent hydrolase